MGKHTMPFSIVTKFPNDIRKGEYVKHGNVTIQVVSITCVEFLDEKTVRVIGTSRKFDAANWR